MRHQAGFWQIRHYWRPEQSHQGCPGTRRWPSGVTADHPTYWNENLRKLFSITRLDQLLALRQTQHQAVELIEPQPVSSVNRRTQEEKVYRA